jgi:GNAT superfamily N-acetyltransferase
MKFIPLNRQGLEEYIQSPLFTQQNEVPISVHRAVSQIANPRLKPDDILLILAVENNQLAGYCGMLPDNVLTSDQKRIHFAWYSCLWAAPQFRGKGLARKLLDMAIEHWHGMIMFTDFVPAIRGFYLNTGYFSDVVVQSGFRWYFKSDLATLLPPKSSKWKRAMPVLKALDSTFNFALKCLPGSKNSYSLGINTLWQPAPESREFLKIYQSNHSIKRSIEEWEWILNFPWILQGEITEFDQKYYFSSKAKEFTNQVFDLKDKLGNRVALVMLMLRNGTLKMPHVAYVPNAEKQIAAFIRAFCKQHEVKRFVCNQPELAQHLKKDGLGAVFCKPFNKEWIVSNALAPYLTGLLADGDGDAAFT